MAEMTNAAFEAWIDSNINTNGVRAITGSLMNEAFTNISNSLYFALTKTQKAPVTRGINTITFEKPYSVGSSYQLIIGNLVDTSGNNMDYKIISQDITGFVIEVVDDGTLNYFTIKNN